MDDLISRQDAIKVLTRKEREEFNDWERSGDERSLCAKKAYSSSIFVIYDLPSADAVEVVRCKDCKYQDKGENESESWNVCKYRPWLYFSIDDDDYCSYGERKDV